MRRFLLSISVLLWAVPAFSETFEVDTDVSRVTVYAEGALITREAFVDIPGGLHQIVLREPANSFDDVPNIILPSGAGLRLISAELIDLNGVPAITEDSPLYLSRLEDLQQAKDAFAAFAAGDIALEADIASAETILRAMESLSGPDGNLVGGEGPLDAEATINLVTLMSVKAFEARAKLEKAQLALDARDAERGILLQNVEIAEAALAATPREAVNLATFVITVEASRRVAGALRVESFTRDAGWSPNYRLELDYEGMTGSLGISRQAFVRQNSGLDWVDARVTLSTADPSAPTGVVLPRPNILGLIEAMQARTLGSYAPSSMDQAEMLAEPMLEAVEVVDGIGGLAAQPLGAGEPVEYKLPEAITLASARDGGILVEIDQLEVPVDLFAEAIAPRDETAKLATRFTYDRPGVLLAGHTSIFHNGAFVGNGFLPEIASGDEAKIGLGPLKSLLIKHRIVSREDGDRGLITSSNAREVRTETEVVNLSDQDVSLSLYDVLPVSEAEDLRVTEISQPKPDNRDVEGRRGVLEWTLDLRPDDTRVIRFGYDLAWPKDFDILPK